MDMDMDMNMNMDMDMSIRKKRKYVPSRSYMFYSIIITNFRIIPSSQNELTNDAESTGIGHTGPGMSQCHIRSLIH